MRELLTAILLTVALCYGSAQPFRIMSYNTENLFDTINDPLTLDDTFTPEGEHKWNSYRYWNKLQHLSEVIVNVGEWQHAALVALVEVESDTCLRDLTLRSSLRRYGYRYIHYDSPDLRGIDVALLYDPEQFTVIEDMVIRNDSDFASHPTRDILYVKGLMPNQDTLHLMICHAPSQLGGKGAGHRRLKMLSRIDAITDSILTANPYAQIVVTGDFNDNPKSIAPHIKRLDNLMNQKADSLLYMPEPHVWGTYNYQEIWSILDQIMVSESLKNKSRAYIYNAEWLIEQGKPHRTFQNTRYDNRGYSDHLPVIVDIY